MLCNFHMNISRLLKQASLTGNFQAEQVDIQLLLQSNLKKRNKDKWKSSNSTRRSKRKKKNQLLRMSKMFNMKDQNTLMMETSIWKENKRRMNNKFKKKEKMAIFKEKVMILTLKRR